MAINKPIDVKGTSATIWSIREAYWDRTLGCVRLLVDGFVDEEQEALGYQNAITSVVKLVLVPDGFVEGLEQQLIDGNYYVSPSPDASGLVPVEDAPVKVSKTDLDLTSAVTVAKPTPVTKEALINE